MFNYKEANTDIIVNFHNSLNEKDKRRHAAMIYKNSSWNIEYVSKLLLISENTIRKGYGELLNVEDSGRIRKVGGGRKSKLGDSDLMMAFDELIKDFTAGDPCNSEVKYTNLSKGEIAEILRGMGFELCSNTVGKILKSKKFKKRKIQKRKSLKSVAGRNEQFERINAAKADFMQRGQPVLSVDTKKKESIGENQRDGLSYANGQLNGYDHTYPSENTGKAVPHGIYDIKRNEGYVSVGNSAETADFIIDNLIYWWINFGVTYYPEATDILLLFDAGGANSYLSHLFKIELDRLRNEIGLNIQIKHYPSYTSKWNPIEHRVFPHISRVLQGVFIRSFDEFIKLVNRAKTKTGLKVIAYTNDKIYETGKRGSKEEVDNIDIIFDDIEPKWNYELRAA